MFTLKKRERKKNVDRKTEDKINSIFANQKCSKNRLLKTSSKVSFFSPYLDRPYLCHKNRPLFAVDPSSCNPQNKTLSSHKGIKDSRSLTFFRNLQIVTRSFPTNFLLTCEREKKKN